MSSSRLCYQDLDDLQRQNIAKTRAFDMGRRNILPQDPIARKEIAEMSLEDIGKSIDKIIEGIIGIDALLYPIPPGNERSAEEDSAIAQKAGTIMNTILNLTRKFKDINDDPEELKTVKPKEWNKQTRRFKDIRDGINFLHDLVVQDLIFGIYNIQVANVRGILERLHETFNQLEAAYNQLSSNIKTFGAGRKRSEEDPYVGGVGGERISPMSVQWRFR